MNGYTHQVNYSKRFTKGLLVGHVYHAHLRFADEASAKTFIAREGEILPECAGSGAFRLEDMQLINLVNFA